LSAEWAEMADVGVRIPLAVGVESLNVAIAAALILYEAKRQRLSSQGENRTN
jgi:RNA methyltransferase, TrmH family